MTVINKHLPWKPCLVFIICFLHVITATPIFFGNPFASTKAPDGETENVSIYTTMEPSANGSASTEHPSVYLQIARNVLERITTPVVSHFILAGSSEKSGKIVSTTQKPTTTTTEDSELEFLEETVYEYESTNSSHKFSFLNETEEITDREVLHPEFIEKNPSFNKKLTKDSSKPERLVLYPYVRAVEERSDTAGEVNDLNSEFPNAKENEVDPDDILTVLNDKKPDDDSVEEVTDDDVDFEDDLPEGNRASENGFIHLLEFLASIVTLAWGAINALFTRRSVTD